MPCGVQVYILRMLLALSNSHKLSFSIFFFLKDRHLTLTQTNARHSFALTNTHYLSLSLYHKIRVKVFSSHTTNVPLSFSLSLSLSLLTWATVAAAEAATASPRKAIAHALLFSTCQKQIFENENKISSSFVMPPPPITSHRRSRLTGCAVSRNRHDEDRWKYEDIMRNNLYRKLLFLFQYLAGIVAGHFLITTFLTSVLQDETFESDLTSVGEMIFNYSLQL